MRIAIALLLAVTGIARASGHGGPTAQDAQTFRAGVELVRVDVSVTRGGQPLRGLAAGDFSVVDAGVPQRVNSVTLLEDVPVSILMALDTSGSVAGERLQHLIDAGTGMIGALRKGDRASLITFSDRVSVQVPLTADLPNVSSAPADLEGRGPTSLRDAIWMALQSLPSDDSRPLVLVFSDGFDTASWLTESQIVEGSRRAGAVIHVVELVAPEPAASFPARGVARTPPVRPPSFIATLAGLSGGRSWSATSSRDLRELFTKAVEEMRARYLVTFYPEGPRKPGWHELKIDVKGRADVRARPGYYLAPRG